MSELYLIAHKVRGEPAFDVAEQMVCPECRGLHCPECDQCGWWWVVPTSGHRAYPYWSIDLGNIDDTFELTFSDDHRCMEGPGFPPNGIPDHYLTRAAPARPAFLDNLLRKPSVSINRRGL